MKIIFAGVTLADFFDPPAKDVRANGAQVVEAVDIVGASNKKLFPRGNSLIALSFGVTRVFSTAKEAEVFFLTHFDTTTKTGTCECQCGTSGDYQSVYLYNAVIEAAPSIVSKGAAVEVQYLIKAAQASTSTPPQFLLDDSDIMILKDSEALTASTTYIDVTFSSTFAAKPVVKCTIAIPSGGDQFAANVVDDLTTTTGFRAAFTAPVPATGSYFLNWAAMY